MTKPGTEWQAGAEKLCAPSASGAARIDSLYDAAIPCPRLPTKTHLSPPEFQPGAEAEELKHNETEMASDLTQRAEYQKSPQRACTPCPAEGSDS